MQIVIRRGGALGDVICVTPIIRRLRRENPSARIVVETGCPDVFENNPYLGGSSADHQKRVIDLDLAYEKRPSMHVVDAYMLEAFGDAGNPDDKSMAMWHERRWRDAKGSILIHAASSWPNRTFSRPFWNEIAARLRRPGREVIFIGSGQDYRGPGAPFDTTIGHLSLHQTAALIDDAALLIGADSALLHVGGTTQTPMVGLYTCARAAYRMPYRYGKLGWSMVGLEPEIDCVGCLERVPAPNTNYRCERGDNACVSLISPDRVQTAAEALLAGLEPG